MRQLSSLARDRLVTLRQVLVRGRRSLRLGELAGWGAADQFIIDNSADVESSITYRRRTRGLLLTPSRTSASLRAVIVATNLT